MDADNLQIVCLDAKHKSEAARVYAEAFRNDTGFNAGWGIRPGLMPVFWEELTGLFLSTWRGESRIYAMTSGREVLACATVQSRDWLPGTGAILKFVFNYGRRLGILRLARFWQRGIEDCVKTTVPEGGLHLVALASDVRWRGRGLGARLLQHLRQEAERKGYKLIQLEVEVDSPAKHLYEREGYRVVKQVRLAGEALYIMRLDLDNTEGLPIANFGGGII